jgi:[glutamine synthetase] adenylyltransferase / [glutamine synthetase]-adenylyl-L-tyrosine phosphorylase
MQAAERIDMLLAGSPDRRTASRYLGRLRAESPLEFYRISHSQAALRAAVAVFSYSNFLSEAVLRDPGRLVDLAASNRLYRVLSVEELAHALAARPMGFAAFRRRELLRIALRDILGVAELAEITRELSNLADAILDAAYHEVRSRLAERHGEPHLPDGSPAGFSVLSLGKLGGSELNYSSDVDLMFVYSGNGHTDGAATLTNKEFFKKLANEYTALLSAYTPEGQCYRVDLRLRPDGAGGEICLPEDATRIYYAERARDWEKQMLIKARVSAGEREPGERLLDFVEPLIYRSSLDFRAVEAVSETRQRISEKMAARRKSRGLDVKLTPGGIRDIEFLVQCLQRLHGGRVRWVRHGGTLLALSRLRDKNLLSDGEYARLATAYQFLRAVEHRLQLEEDRQTHTLPSDADALEVLARKMPAEATGAGLTATTFTARLDEHLAAVREIYDRVVRPTAPPAAPAVAPRRRELQRFERFQELTGAAPAGIAEIFDLSSYFGDELLRDPGLAAEVGQPFTLDAAPADLRRFYRAQMLRIQSRSILESAPIFESLNQTSELADYVIRAAYEQAGARGGEMMVIALGRLGMREFDLGSDADLVFVTPDGADLRFWTGVAERMIQTITAYTGGGVMFAIDTRLRPNGREGELVLSESAYKTYFAEKAEAWEGITYMKSRPVAGNAERATAFLHELQQVDWRRYGQSMRSREELAHMRARLEKEQGSRNPLKAGAGGYYDIDFALMYLRLRGAGIFYKTLNTPERIEVIESIGHMPKSDAEFLRRAATLYRAIDHGQRIATGRAEGSLPSSLSQVETLTRLVHRWIPPEFHAHPLPETLADIRRQTRQYFNRLFGVSAPVPPSTK